jgi:hypothetical protein
MWKSLYDPNPVEDFPAQQARLIRRKIAEPCKLHLMQNVFVLQLERCDVCVAVLTDRSGYLPFFT